jgi:hypothetical protein
MSQIDVEASFAEFVRFFGGEVVEDSHGTSLPFSNADYIFKDQNVIGELKRLVDNKSKDEDIQAKIQAKFDAWMRDGTIDPIYGRVSISSHTLPERCQRELIDIFKPALQKRILKANKQIRETASSFGMPDAKGLLFIANDGNYALEADAAVYLIHRILGNDCSSINSVVYFTVNMTASSPVTEKYVFVWVHTSRKKIIEPVDHQFVMSLFDAWRSHLERMRNEPIEKILAKQGDLESIRYDKPL